MNGDTDNSDNLVPVTPLLITVAAVVGITSVVWFVVGQQQAGRVAEQRAALEQQLQQAAADKRELQQQYRSSQTALDNSRRRHAEREQQLTQQLDQQRQQLADYETANWPSRYARLEAENQLLDEQLARQGERLATIEQDYQALAGRHRDLQASHDELEQTHAALAQRFSASRRSDSQELLAAQVALEESERRRRNMDSWNDVLAADLISVEIDQARLQQQIATLTAEQQTLQTQLATLRARNDTLTQDRAALAAELRQARAAPPPLETLRQTPPAAVVPVTAGAAANAEPAAADGANTNTGGFRLTRLASLQSTLGAAAPADRGDILLAVIPTIPDGLRGAELAALLDKLPPEQIVGVIEAGREHIQRPLDDDSAARIVSRLGSAEERQTVRQLLQ